MRTKTFRGGYRFRKFSGQPQDKLLELGLPPKVIIPLAQGFSIPLEPKVEIGEEVYAGQIIAHSDEKLASPIHSSVNGRVVNIEKRNYFNREVLTVIIETDQKNKEYKPLPGYGSSWDKLTLEQIERLLYEAGVTALDREGIPTRFRTSFISPQEVEDLIIHGAGSEIYNISLDVLLSGRNLYKFVEGIKILKKIMPQARVHLALKRDKKAIIEKLKKLTFNLDKFQIFPVVSKYPQGYDEVLIPTLLNKPFPYGYSAANIGIVVLNVQAIIHVYEAVAEGKPLIERIIALCGAMFKENLHIKVRLGTPIEFILKNRCKEGRFRLVRNSLLTGEELKDYQLPVDKTFSQLIALAEDNYRKMFAFLRLQLKEDSYGEFFFSFFKKGKIPTTNMHGEERPCIQCGYCIEVCPVRIFPNLIYRQSKLGINEILMQYGVFNCINCNLCSYVCPSKIPLAKHINDTKTKLIDIGCDNSLCILPKFNLKGLYDYKGVKKLR